MTKTLQTFSAEVLREYISTLPWESPSVPPRSVVGKVAKLSVESVSELGEPLVTYSARVPWSEWERATRSVFAGGITATDLRDLGALIEIPESLTLPDLSGLKTVRAVRQGAGLYGEVKQTPRSPGLYTLEYEDISHVKRANQAKGGFWFTRETMRAFGTRVGDTVYAGRYFISSDIHSDGERRYSVRVAFADGDVTTATGIAGNTLYGYTERGAALSRLRAHWNSGLRAEVERAVNPAMR